MVRAARKTVLLADHTKVGAVCLHRYADLTDIDLLVTDSGLAPELAEEIAAAGPEVVVA
jgi:DeoR family fructose operon transcriptional repressor